MGTDDDAKRKAQELLASLPPLEEVASPEVQRILERAKQDVRERGDRGMSSEHLLRAFLVEPAGAEILGGAGADVEALDRDLTKLIELAARPGADSAGPIAACEAVKKLAVLGARRPGSTSVSVGELLTAYFFVPAAPGLARLKKHRVTRVDVLRYISHRITTGGRRAALPRARLLKGDVESRSRGLSECDVVLQNDDYTSVEFVIELLQALFDKSADDAAAIAKATHENRRSVIGRYEQKAAAKKIERAHRRAEKAGFPLLLSIEPTSGAKS